MATLEELHAEQDELRKEITDLDTEYRGKRYDEAGKQKWNKANERLEELSETIAELEARDKRIKALGENDGATVEGADFMVPSPRTKGRDVFDLSRISSPLSDPSVVRRELHDRVKEAVEGFSFPQRNLRTEDGQQAIASLLDKDDEAGSLAAYVLRTGSPTYKMAFTKAIAKGPETLTQDEQRTLSTGGTAGGYAVPITLDPTVVPVSDSSVNPFRAISRVEQITTTVWKGVATSGVSAQFQDELVEASDNSPQFTQPSIEPNKAQVFIPFSVEIGDDWSAIQAELGRLVGDAKDDLEATRFISGTAASSLGGINVVGTSYVATGGTSTFSSANLFALEEALGPRFRSRASFVGNRAIYNKVRQFGAEANLWIDSPQGAFQPGLTNQVPTPGGLGKMLLGYPTYEASAMPSTVAANNFLLVFGDFNYYVIVDRIGMQVEIIPHLFGSNQRPIGARGLYAYWRVGSDVLSVNAFRALKAAAS